MVFIVRASIGVMQIFSSKANSGNLLPVLKSGKGRAMFSWERQSSWPTFLLIAFVLLSIPTTTNAVTEARIDRRKNKVLEETQFSNPKSFDYNFEDDLRKPADTNDIYDELVPYLPTFVLHKNGKDVGRTSVPIITRKMPAWSTPPPKQKYVEPYKPFSPKPLEGFRRLPGLTGLAVLVANPFDQTRFSQRSQQRQQHNKTPQRTASVAPQQSLARSTVRPKSSSRTTVTYRTTTRASRSLLQQRQRQQQQQNQQHQQQQQKRQQQQQQRHLEAKQPPRLYTRITRTPATSSRSNNINYKRPAANVLVDAPATTRRQQQQQQKQKQQQQQQPRPLSKLVGYPQPLSEKQRTSSPRAAAAGVVRSQPLERYNSNRNSNRNSNSKTVIRSRSIQSRPPVKPLIINTGDGPYSGPTFNCRVLTPKNDGRPSPSTDKSCALKAPGISADGSCRCTFEITERDSNGCAQGFLFTCSRK